MKPVTNQGLKEDSWLYTPSDLIKGWWVVAAIFFLSTYEVRSVAINVALLEINLILPGVDLTINSVHTNRGLLPMLVEPRAPFLDSHWSERARGVHPALSCISKFTQAEPNLLN